MLPWHVWLLDKEDPPAESFIDGMLADELPRRRIARAILLVSRSGKGAQRPHAYGRAVCLPLLWRRRGVGRLFNAVLGWWFLHRLQARATARGRPMAVFARNEPTYLLAAVCHRPRATPRIFQQTFPHERHSGHALTRLVARGLLRLGCPRVDGLLAVSPLGLARLRGYGPTRVRGEVIPLLAARGERVAATGATAMPLEFVYAGTHASARQLERVIEGMVQAVRSGVNARFTFIGGTAAEQARLLEVPGAAELKARGVLVLRGPVPRSQLVHELPAYHVGLSLIPPNTAYREASPTKLAEYMGAGLAVLATRGISLQEQFVAASGAGRLVNYSATAIAEGIRATVAEGPEGVATQRRAALLYAATALDYGRFIPVLEGWAPLRRGAEADYS